MYVRKSSRKNYKRKTYRKGSTLNKKIATISKAVALRQQETKHAVHNWGNFELYHNISQRVTDNLIKTSQGVGDGNGSDTVRIGDEITGRGIKLYLQFQDKWDRSNVTFCVWVAKCRQSIAGSLSVPRKNITGVLPMDPLDLEQCMKVIVNKKYRFSHKDTMIDLGEGVDSLNKVTTHFRTLWIPLNNMRYKYTDQNSTQGTAFNYAMWIAAYDSSGDLITDNIGSIRVASEIFFKDG